MCDGIYSEELFDERYTVIRKDRNTSATRGGGVLVAFNKKLPYELLETKEECNVECLFVRVRFEKVSVIVSVVYFKPNSSLDDYISYFNQFESLLTSEQAKTLILGDFNLPLLDTCDNDRNNALGEFLNLHNLQQLNNIKNFRDRCLDLLISNIEISLLTKPTHTLVAEDMYHPALLFQIPLKEKDEPFISKKYIYNYSKGNFLLLYNLIKDHSWGDLFAIADVDASLKYFYDHMYGFLDMAVPKQIIKNSGNKPRFPQWYSMDLIRKIREKNKLHRIISKKKQAHPCANILTT